jgi:hypothetical protein
MKSITLLIRVFIRFFLFANFQCTRSKDNWAQAATVERHTMSMVYGWCMTDVTVKSSKSIYHFGAEAP